MECLLSYIEFTQFHQYLLQLMPSYEAINIRKHQELPSNVPDAAIICTETPSTSKGKTDELEPSEVRLKSAKRRAYKLYTKYIAIGSAYEINISYVMRTELSNILGAKHELMHRPDISLTTLYELFVEPKDEMFQLLSFSFVRFKVTDQFKEFLQSCPPQKRRLSHLPNLSLTPIKSGRSASVKVDKKPDTDDYLPVIKTPNLKTSPSSDSVSPSKVDDNESGMVYVDYN